MDDELEIEGIKSDENKKGLIMGCFVPEDLLNEIKEAMDILDENAKQFMINSYLDRIRKANGGD